MPRSTLKEARRRLEEEVTPNLNDFVLRQHQATLAAAEKRARAAAERYVATREEEVLKARDSALRELTAVRDEADALRREGETGRMPAADYSHRLDELRARHAGAELQLASANAITEQLVAVEEDPLAWYDDLARRQPHMQVEVSW